MSDRERVIDVHGHYTTYPPQVAEWRSRQVRAFENGEPLPDPEDLVVTDDELVESVATHQLAGMDARGIDVTLFSPRASRMAHHVGNLEVSTAWARVCNRLVARICALFPDRFQPVAMLPQTPGAPPASVLPELERSVREHGVVGVNLNPDPSGGAWSGPPLGDRAWYPVYEALVAQDLPAMIHVSASANPALQTTGDWYLGADTTAFVQLLRSDVLADFPGLRLIIPHGGGAAAFHWGRFRGMAQDQGRPPLEEHLLGGLLLDTCVYHQAGIDLLFGVVPTENILFGSEAVGAVRGVDPRTGHHYDDTRRYVDAAGLGAAERALVYEGNARRTYPRLDRALGSGRTATAR